VVLKYCHFVIVDLFTLIERARLFKRSKLLTCS